MVEPSAPSRYVVVGAGAVGGLLAAQLAGAGRRVVLVARGEHGKRIATNGLVVRRPTGVDVVELPVASDPEQLDLRAEDVLLLTVKTQDADAAVAHWAWRPVLDAAGRTLGPAATQLPIVTFQNGIATEDLALRRFARVYGATVAVAASYLTPGEIVSPSVDPTALVWVGRYPSGSDVVAERLVDDLVTAGIAAYAVDDIRPHKAVKLLGNLSSNGLDLLEGSGESRAVARTLLRDEALGVLVAAGVPLLPGATLDPTAARLTIQPVDGHEGGHLSTWQSFARGTSSEIDYLNGEIVLLARRHRLSAPLNERLQLLLGSADPEGGRTLANLLAGAGAGVVVAGRS